MGPQSQGSLRDSPATEGDIMLPATTRTPLQLRIALAVLVSIACLAFGASPSAVAASSSTPSIATIASAQADHNLARRVSDLKKCLREHPRHCTAQARSVRLAKQALAATRAQA